MKQLNNKILIIVLVVLAAAFVLTKLVRTPARESNLDMEAFKVDTARIDRIVLSPSAAGALEITMTKKSGQWTVSNGPISSRADVSVVKNLLRQLASLTPERIVSRSEEKWDDYGVADSTGTELTAANGETAVIKLRIGKQSAGNTYLRLLDQPEIYSVEGAIASITDRKFNEWRDPLLIRLSPDSINKITFTYPVDSGFVLTRNNKSWLINGAAADSASVARLFNELRRKALRQFADSVAVAATPDVTVTFEGGRKPFTIRGWKNTVASWVLTSDEQPGVKFLDVGDRVAEELFPNKKSMTK